MTGRRYTKQERQVLVESYGRIPTSELSQRFGRTVHSLHQAARRLGLQKPRDARLIEKQNDQIIALHSEGNSSYEIADAIGMESRTVRWRLKKLGLAANGISDRTRARLREAMERQCAREGVPTLGHFRSKRMRDIHRRYGWPENLSLRGCQILETLYRHGPLTRRQIAALIGVPWRGSKTFNNSRVAGHSYTAELVHAGLVVRLQKAVKRSGKGQNEDLFILGLGVEPCHQQRTQARQSACEKSKRA